MPERVAEMHLSWTCLYQSMKMLILMVFYSSKYATDAHLILRMQRLTEAKFDSIWTSLYEFYFGQSVMKATDEEVDDKTTEKFVSSNSWELVRNDSALTSNIKYKINAPNISNESDYTKKSSLRNNATGHVIRHNQSLMLAVLTIEAYWNLLLTFPVIKAKNGMYIINRLLFSSFLVTVKH